MKFEPILSADTTCPPMLSGAAEVDLPFRVLRQGRCIELEHEGGATFAFLLNSARTGVIECRRPSEHPDYETFRVAAHRFCARIAHEAGLIFHPRAA
jgi:hypothetical protein